MRHSFVAAVMLRYVLLLVLALPALVLAAGMEHTEADALAARAAAALGGFTVAAHAVIALCAWARRAKRRVAAKRPSAFAALMAAGKTQIVQPGQKRTVAQGDGPCGEGCKRSRQGSKGAENRRSED